MNTLTNDVVAAKPFQRYIDLVKDQELLKALKKSKKSLLKLLEDIPEKKIGYRYAEGKWTIRQLVQHIIDAERVFTYRALWFARNDNQPLPGFEENSWAMHATAAERQWDQLIEEFRHVRSATILMFQSFDETELKATGFASNNLVSVSALGYICSGHVEHHIRIIKERYLA
jgi:hypothetical protein